VLFLIAQKWARVTFPTRAVSRHKKGSHHNAFRGLARPPGFVDLRWECHVSDARGAV